ncbi:MAG: hypothetical protein J2P52_01745 [Blastocatellia bacterium]|nr:hypothetical protein [Blastocatellia bacterium]
MSEQRERALIGDENPRRTALLKGLFEQEFSGVEFAWFQTFQEAHQQARADAGAIIFFSRNLPHSSKSNSAILEYYFSELGKVQCAPVCIFGEDGKPDLHESFQEQKFLYVPAVEPSFAQERRNLISAFRRYLKWSPPLPEIDLEPDHPLLTEQVRSLAGSRKLDDGKKLLAQLVRGFFVCDKVKVASLGQGKSGSRVFRIRPEPCPEANTEFILKLVEKRAEWKILYEIDGYKKARKILDQSFRTHTPRIRNTCSPQNAPPGDLFEHVSSTIGNNWEAICYVFLGGENLGQFIDLESVLIAEASELQEKFSSPGKPGPQPAFSSKSICADRLAMLSKVLEWLREQWHAKAQASRDAKQLWETPDAPSKQYSPLPPYRFTGEVKERAIAFLDSFDARLGKRFPLPCDPPDWSARIGIIRDLLSQDSGATGFSRLDRASNVLLSPAHGDLNAANVLLWLEQKEHPFLIDFPFYQEEGHAVQDFARLEVEMKFMLLDRQADSPAGELPAFDYTPTQMALWLELEEHLLNDWKQSKRKERDWKQHGYKTNVICCLELIQLIRNAAEDVYRNAGAAGDFPDEYWAALLFQTLRVLGYPSVSIFKRLFAVYSAGSILEKLR